jgi:uncharacterized 2Fe-2S/4Fe-4S cluster protein (DUF4445 family)
MSDVTTLSIEFRGSVEHLRLEGSSCDASLSSVLRHESMPLNTRCGERGVCDGCLVDLLRGRMVVELERGLTRVVTAPAERLRACKLRLLRGEDVTVHVPDRSLLTHRVSAESDFVLPARRNHDPLGLPSSIDEPLGLAIDLGTTTIVVMLVELHTGRILARSAEFNRQMRLGDDVLTRITLAMGRPDVLEQLRAAAMDETILPLIDDCLRQSGAAPERLVAASLAGNTTMLHLLAGEDPTSLGVAPFTARFLGHRVLEEELHRRSLGRLPKAPLHLLPSASAYVGADIVAGLVATGMRDDDRTSLLVDAGTNGEIVLKHKGRYFGCATAAGPAFEGAGLRDGIRAGDGAGSHLTIDTHGQVHVEVIGGHHDKLIGLCGSFYLDWLAEGRRAGVLDASGRINSTPPCLADRVLALEGAGRAFRVGFAAGRRPVVVSDADVARLLSAKAAIAAGILTLLERQRLQPADVDVLHLAGGFGTHLRRSSAIGCGLLPGFAESQIRVVGNSSLAGAYLTLLDRSLPAELELLARRVEVIELNTDPGFEERFLDQLMLPE